jgi:hypothetical protein
MMLPPRKQSKPSSRGATNDLPADLPAGCHPNSLKSLRPAGLPAFSLRGVDIMKLPPPRICRLIRRLHAMTRSSNPNEASVAKTKLERLLFEWSLSESDIDGIIKATNDSGQPNGGGATSGTVTDDDIAGINLFDLIFTLLAEHVVVTIHEYTAAALWNLHTYVFRKFRITPRLATLSPTHGCGKSTLLDLLELLCANPFCSADPTPATIYHERDENPDATLLIDEVDNLGLFHDPKMRKLFNAGHKVNGFATRFIDGRNRKFDLFGPLALAAIGALPPPLMSRSIVVDMQKAVPPKRLDPNDRAFMIAQELCRKFMLDCLNDPKLLNLDPPMPAEITDPRMADNWRPLIAIADALGRGEQARQAAVAMCAIHTSTDTRIALLTDIRTVRDMRGGAKIWGSTLVRRYRSGRPS